MATAKKDLTDPRVQGHHSFDSTMTSFPSTRSLVDSIFPRRRFTGGATKARGRVATGWQALAISLERRSPVARRTRIVPRAAARRPTLRDWRMGSRCQGRLSRTRPQDAAHPQGRQALRRRTRCALPWTLPPSKIPNRHWEPRSSPRNGSRPTPPRRREPRTRWFPPRLRPLWSAAFVVRRSAGHQWRVKGGEAITQ